MATLPVIIISAMNNGKRREKCEGGSVKREV
jgi:hypothetical protein